MTNQEMTNLKSQIDLLSKQIELMLEENSEKSSSNDSEVFSKISGFLGFSSDMEKDAVLKTLLRCAKNVVNAGGAGLTLYDEEKNKLVFVAETGDGSGFIGYEIPIEDSVHGLAFVTGEIQSSTPLHKDVESKAKAAFRNVLVAPLFVNGEGIGTMSAVNKQNGDNFTSKDMEAYKYFADLAAIIIQQKIREKMLKSMLLGKDDKTPDSLKDLKFSKSDVSIMEIIQELSSISKYNEDVLDNFKTIVKFFKRR